MINIAKPTTHQLSLKMAILGFFFAFLKYVLKKKKELEFFSLQYFLCPW